MAVVKDPERGFHLRIKTLYDIEKQLEVALPKMAEAATDPKLESGFLSHLEETQEQISRLEEIFQMIEARPEKHAGDTIRGLIADGNTIINTEAPDSLRDEMLAGAGRDVEHFEIACYMNAITEAKGLGLNEAVALLEASLSEEIAAEKKLERAFKENLQLASERITAKV